MVGYIRVNLRNFILRLSSELIYCDNFFRIKMKIYNIADMQDGHFFSKKVFLHANPRYLRKSDCPFLTYYYFAISSHNPSFP